MIDLDVRLPLQLFDLRVQCTLVGQVNAVVGPSGSGKTTLLETIAGIRKGASGRIAVDNDVFLDSTRGVSLAPEERRVGFVPQDAALFPHLTVRENILFARRRDGFDGVCSTLEIENLLERYPLKLSGGERQRVALARALMSRPRLLLLDEPLASVDQPLRERLLRYLRLVRDTFNIPMIYVTHQIVEAMALSDFALAMRKGTVFASGRSEEVLHNTSVAERDAVENVLLVDQPRHFPDRGLTHVRTASGVQLAIPYDEVREARFPLVISVSGEDVVVFTEEPHAISARNVLRGRISRLVRLGGTVEMTVDTPTRLYVRATAEAADDLALAEGSLVWLALRTRAIRVIG